MIFLVTILKNNTVFKLLNSRRVDYESIEYGKIAVNQIWDVRFECKISKICKFNKNRAYCFRRNQCLMSDGRSSLTEITEYTVFAYLLILCFKMINYIRGSLKGSLRYSFYILHKFKNNFDQFWILIYNFYIVKLVMIGWFPTFENRSSVVTAITIRRVYYVHVALAWCSVFHHI